MQRAGCGAARPARARAEGGATVLYSVIVAQVHVAFTELAIQILNVKTQALLNLWVWAYWQVDERFKFSKQWFKATTQELWLSILDDSVDLIYFIAFNARFTAKQRQFAHI